jgi:hypothetical protein
MNHFTSSWNGEVCSPTNYGWIQKVRAAFLSALIVFASAGFAGATWDDDDDVPSNDLCSGALTINCGQVKFGSTENATADDIDFCGNTPFGQVSGEPGVWYKHVGTGANVRLRLNEREEGTSFDTFIGVYTGSCEDLVCFGGDDDNGVGLNSFYEFYAAPGVTYYIYVTGWDTDGIADDDSGRFRFKLRCIPACEDDLDVICPDDAVSVNCGEENNYEITGFPSVDFNSCNDNASVSVIPSDNIVSDNGCVKVISRTWTITLGDLTETCTQLITVIDNQGPVISGVEPVVNVQCREEIPAPADASASDACSGDTDVETFFSQSGLVVSRCTLSTAFGPGPDWAFWAPDLFAQGISASVSFNFVGPGILETYNDGTAHLFGLVANDVNNSQQFQLDMWFQNKSDWDQWSSLGRGYKDDLNCATPTSLYELWTYYELVNNFSTAIGQGSLAGVELYLEHMPANYYFGFQIGQGANNKNCQFGASAWFTYTGFNGNDPITGHGDINVNATCVPVPNLDCFHNTSATYLYRAQDACGRQTIAVQTIVVNDTTPPTFDNCPANLTLECGDNVPASALPTATDNCSGEVTVIELPETEVGNDCNRVITRRYEARDLCGNTAICRYTITIVDTTAPEFDSTPERTITVNCDEVPAQVVLTATDICDESVTVLPASSITPGNCPGNYTIERSWSVSDDCGNDTTIFQTVNVVDLEGPVFDAYPFYTQVSCELVAEYTITATDACSGATVVITSEVLNSGGCLGVLHRVYTATDLCGNTTTAEQYITITDNVNPTLNNVPGETTVECALVEVSEGGLLFGIGDVTASDNCDNNATLTYREVIVPTNDDCPNSYDVIRIWRAEDVCENFFIDSALVHVVDTEGPIFSVAPQDTTINCNQSIPAANAQVYDECGAALVANFDSTILGNCPQNYTIKRTFRATDECGNTSFHIQYIYVLDEEAPDFIENQRLFTYECGAQIPVIQPVATDNCGAIDYDYTDSEVDATNPCLKKFYRTWVAEDQCNNASEFVQTIFIEDTTAPVFDAYEMQIPRDCGDYQGVYVTAQDVCNGATITFRDQVVSGSCQGRVIRMYYATDACGNVDSTQQIINLIDTENPTANQPLDREVSCISEWSFDTVIFADNCDESLDIDTTFASSFDGCERTFTRTLVATDNCGNPLTVDQTITVVDNIDPFFTSVPASFSASCDQQLEYASATGDDLCTEANIDVTVDTVFFNCIRNYDIVREFVITDACGNDDTAYQTISVRDLEGPQFTQGQAIEYTYECDEDIPVIEPTATDNCSAFASTYTDSERLPNTTTIAGYDGEGIYLDLTAYDGLVTLTIQTTEESGIFHFINIPGVDLIAENAGTLTYTLIGGQVYGPCTAPNGTLYIGNETPVGGINLVLVEEGGDDWNDMVLTVDQGFFARLDDSSIETQLCGEHFDRTWLFTDACGNESRFVQRINVVDTTAPVVEDFQVEIDRPCEDFMGQYISATDNCNGVIITHTDRAFSGTCLGYIERTYTVKDSCGNVTDGTFIQIINLIDTEAPEVVTEPQDLSFECVIGLEIPEFTPEFTDNCDANGVAVEFDENEVAVECFTIITRTWIAEDDCGNRDTVDQVITITDTQAPYFTYVPAGYEASCEDELSFEDATAYDACSGVASVTVSEQIIDRECIGTYTIVRTFTARDACGLTADTTQVIRVIDNEAPNFIELPEGGEVACAEFDENDIIATADDDCGTDTVTKAVSVEDYFREASDDEEALCGKKYTFTFTATDDCGNSASESVVYIVFDNVAPYFNESLPTEPITVQCADDVPAFITLTAGDACGSADVVRTPNVLESDTCGNQVIEVVYVATDECGNTARASYQIIVNDTTEPTIETEVSDILLSCDEQIPAPLTIEASDNCSDATVRMTEVVSGPQMPQGAVSACLLSTPNIAQATGCQSYYNNVSWALWLGSNPNGHKYFRLVSGNLYTMNDGSKLVVATFENAQTPALGGFTASVKFDGGLPWAQWSTQSFPTSFKADCGGVDANFASWTYHILQTTPGAELVGYGAYAGSALDLGHAPSTKYFGFQQGDGANNLTPGEGFGGWFEYSGTIILNNQVLYVANKKGGDFAFNLDCCPRTVVTRCWTATDCSGNFTSVCQTIRYQNGGSSSASDIAEETIASKGSEEGTQLNVSVFPNPANEQTTFVFVAKENGNSSIEVFDMAGAKVAHMISNQLVAGSEYRTDLNLNEFAAGIYMYRIVNGGTTEMGRLVVNR